MKKRVGKARKKEENINVSDAEMNRIEHTKRFREFSKTTLQHMNLPTVGSQVRDTS